MKVGELRIDNWVQVDDLPPEQVTLGMFAVLLSFPSHLAKFNGVRLDEEWLKRLGFHERELVRWHGNGQDYQVPFDKGGSTTEQRDFILPSVYGDDDFIVRFQTWRCKDLTTDHSTYFLLHRWYPRCEEGQLICHDTETVHGLQNAFFVATGKELVLLRHGTEAAKVG